MGHGHSSSQPSPDAPIRLWGRERVDGEIPYIELTAQDVWDLARHDVFAPIVDAQVAERLTGFAQDLASGDLQRMRRAMLRLGDTPEPRQVAALLGSWGRYLTGRWEAA